jgi:hypothetical protein
MKKAIAVPELLVSSNGVNVDETAMARATGGLGVGCNIKKSEGLDVFEIVVPRDQREFWGTLLKGKG